MKKSKTTPGKLTKEQVLSIPELLKTRSTVDIAKSMGVKQSAISYWIGILKKRKIRMPAIRKGRKPLL